MKILMLFVFLIFSPYLANADVLITEVAWMGTNVSHNDEWIEIYNDSNVSVDISGWTVNAADGTPQISLSGSIGPNSFFILERTDDTTLPNVSADLIYTGALGNGGENLSLVDSDGAMVHQISGGGGWLAGDNESKYTMQWDGSSWVTSAPTPRGHSVEYTKLQTNTVENVISNLQVTNSVNDDSAIDTIAEDVQQVYPATGQVAQDVNPANESNSEIKEGVDKLQDAEVLEHDDEIILSSTMKESEAYDIFQDEYTELASKFAKAEVRVAELERALLEQKQVKNVEIESDEGTDVDGIFTSNQTANVSDTIVIKREYGVLRNILLIPAKIISFVMSFF